MVNEQRTMLRCTWKIFTFLTTPRMQPIVPPAHPIQRHFWPCAAFVKTHILVRSLAMSYIIRDLFRLNLFGCSWWVSLQIKWNIPHWHSVRIIWLQTWTHHTTCFQVRRWQRALESHAPRTQGVLGHLNRWEELLSAGSPNMDNP